MAEEWKHVGGARVDVYEKVQRPRTPGDGGSWFAGVLGLVLIVGLVAWCGKGSCKSETRKDDARKDDARSIVQPRDTAIVTPGQNHENGVVRSGPGIGFPRVTSLPRGTVVERMESKFGPDQGSAGGTWYRIHTTVNGEAVDGWMHEAILR